MYAEEYQHLIGINASGIERLEDADALKDRVSEWLETPMGTVADHPSWGHTLTKFQFEPPSPDLEVSLEMEVIGKLTKDTGIPVISINAEFTEIDICDLYINFGVAVFDFRVIL